MPPSVPPIKWSGDVEDFTDWSFHQSQMRPGDTTFTYRAEQNGEAYHIHKQKTAPTKKDHAKQERIAKEKLARIKHNEEKKRKAKAKKKRNSSNRRRRVEEAAVAKREETKQRMEEVSQANEVGFGPPMYSSPPSL